MNTATIRVVCAKCESKLDIRAELAGSKRRCPKCKTEFVVPSVEDDAEENEGSAERDTVAETGLNTQAPLSDSDAPSSPVPVTESLAYPAANDDDDDDDYMPSFVTATSREDPKTPLPPTQNPQAADEDEEPVLSIPKISPPPKPKFKSFDADDFGEEEDEPPARSSRTTPPPTAREPRRSQLSDEFDIDEPSPPSKSRGPSRSPGLSDSSMPTTPPTRDRAAAARELRQALKDSSLREMPEQKARKGFDIDFAGLGSEIGLKGVAIIVGTALFCILGYYAVNSMTHESLKLPPLGYVTGTVLYNGQPAVNATVKFTPVPDPTLEKNTLDYNKTRTSYGVTNEKGQYKLLYVEGVQGVAVGMCRVSIDLEPPLVAPGEFSPAGMTIRDVKSGSQTFDFSLTGQDPRP